MKRNDDLNAQVEIESVRYLDKVAYDLWEGAKAYYITRHGISALRRRMITDWEHLEEFDREA